MPFKDVEEKIKKFAEGKAEQFLKNVEKFQNEECTEQSNKISQEICEYIKSLNTNDKYIVNTTIFEKGQLGITMSGTCI